jgi:hypothetical protein
LIEQFGDIQSRTDFMIEVTELLEGEISRVDLIVLRGEIGKVNVPVLLSAYLAALQAEFFQKFEDTLLCSTRGKRFADAERTRQDRCISADNEDTQRTFERVSSCSRSA